VVLALGVVVRALGVKLLREGALVVVEVLIVGALDPLKTLERETELGRLVTVGVVTRGVAGGV
jgi:aconitase B